jgi:hypothetical protein
MYWDPEGTNFSRTSPGGLNRKKPETLPERNKSLPEKIFPGTLAAGSLYQTDA